MPRSAFRVARACSFSCSPGASGCVWRIRTCPPAGVALCAQGSEFASIRAFSRGNAGGARCAFGAQ
eukprot:1156245-Lingulodinium_polyedra.AAC.1